jgi:hypothetical protein
MRTFRFSLGEHLLKAHKIIQRMEHVSSGKAGYGSVIYGTVNRLRKNRKLLKGTALRPYITNLE